MWCVTVKTGAFVARANGLPFVTGNSGFPKSHNIGKALDALAGAEREVVRIPASEVRNPKAPNSGHGIEGGDRPWMQRALEVGFHDKPGDKPVTPEAQRWDGWGTALAPGHEQWLLARKPTPLTYAKQVLAHGCGAMNIDACRTPTGDNLNGGAYSSGGRTATPTYTGESGMFVDGGGRLPGQYSQPGGRWPANVLLTEGGDGCPVAELDRQSGDGPSSYRATRRGSGTLACYGDYHLGDPGLGHLGHSDSGGASRFFPRFRYQAKAHDRTAGLRTDVTNKHPTHKTPELMAWLVRLLAAKAEHTGDLPAIVLDPFMGSGTTGIACVRERVRFIGIERDPVQPTDHDSFGVARARILAAIGSPVAAAEANEKAPAGAQLGLL